VWASRVSLLPYQARWLTLVTLSRPQENKKISEAVFSLCFNEHGGTMALGGYDASYHTQPIQVEHTEYT
jgi:hypothetical protein